MKNLLAIVLVFAILFTGTAFAADKETIKAVQAALNEAGYECGAPDGMAGKKTETAISQYQEANNLEVTGSITRELLIAMGIISVSEKAILFRDIEWGTGEADVRAALIDSGFANPDKTYNPANFIKVFPKDSSNALDSDFSVSGNLYPDGGYGTALDALQPISDQKIKIVEFSYLYGIKDSAIDKDDSRLVSVTVNFAFESADDGEKAVASILRDLEQQYGTFEKYAPKNSKDPHVKALQETFGDIKSGDSDFELQCIRYGADNTVVLLRVFGWNNVKLIYMDTDAWQDAEALSSIL